MRSVAYALILGLVSASPAQAGAWLRSEGTGFVATSVAMNRSKDLSTSYYSEYGLSDTMTLGTDIYYGVDRTFFQQGSGILFLRMPIGPTDQTHKFAAHFGLGARYLLGYFYPAAEVGLSWGRGIKWGERYGWVNVDTSYNKPLDDEPKDPYGSGYKPNARVKLDATLGMGITENGKAMIQMFNTFEDGDTYTTLAPSFVFAPGGGDVSVQISAEFPVRGDGETSIKIGVWRTF
jgi:hypothetical protein